MFSRFVTLFLFILLGYTGYVNAQVSSIDSLLERANYLRMDSKYDESYKLFQQLDTLIKPDNYLNRLTYYNYVFNYHKYYGDFVTGLEMNKRAIDLIHLRYDELHHLLPEYYSQRISSTRFADKDIFEKTLVEFRNYLDKHDDEVGESNYIRFIGFQKAIKGKIFSAIKDYEKAISFGKFYTSIDEVICYNNLALFYNRIAKKRKAVESIMHAISILEDMEPSDYEGFCNAYHWLYMIMDKEDKTSCLEALSLATKIKEIGKKLPETTWLQDGFLAMMNCNLNYYNLTKDKKYKEKALTLVDSIKVLERDNPEPVALYAAYNSMCMSALNHKDMPTFEKYFKLSEDIDFNNSQLSKAKRQIRKFWNAVYHEKYEEGLKFIQTGLCQEIRSYENCTDYMLNPGNDEVKSSSIMLLLYHKVKGLVLLFDKTADTKYLDLAHRTWLMYDVWFMENMMENLVETFAKDFFPGVELYHQMYQNTGDRTSLINGLFTAEKEMNINFLLEIRKAFELSESSLPDSIRQQLMIRKENMEYDSRRIKKLAKTDDQDLISAKIEFVNSEKEYLRYQEEVEQKYPDSKPPMILEQLLNKEMLGDYVSKFTNETIIEYALTDDNLYVFILNDSVQKYFPLEVNRQEISQIVFELNKAIEQKSNYIEKSQILYNYLIGPLEKHIATQNVLIVPDRELGLLPFEILHDSDETPLLHNWNIRYTQSLLLQMYEDNNKKERKGTGLLAIGASPEPLLHNDKTSGKPLSQLLGAAAEVDLLSERYKGEFLTNAKATEGNFKAEADAYDIIHLAMHGIMDNDITENSKLVFIDKSGDTEDSYLHAHEIYNLHINADLLTLSACNSGVGEINAGEGVRSIASAFAYAGCSNTVRSLWAVDDAATCFLMAEYYMNLELGLGKGDALTNAKRNFVKNADTKWKHPYYWAGFVYYGNNIPVDLERASSMPYTYILGIACLGIFIFGFLLHKSKTRIL